MLLHRLWMLKMVLLDRPVLRTLCSVYQHRRRHHLHLWQWVRITSRTRLEPTVSTILVLEMVQSAKTQMAKHLTMA